MTLTGDHLRRVDTLTRRQREVLALIASGATNDAICRRLFLSRRTVESHVNAIYLELGLRHAPEDVDRRVAATLTYLARSRSLAVAA